MSPISPPLKIRRKMMSQGVKLVGAISKKKSVFYHTRPESPLIKQHGGNRTSSMNFHLGKASPLLKKLISDNDANLSIQKFRFGK